MTEERAKACEACVETQQRVNEALATSDACWRMEQEVIVRERDEARVEADSARAIYEMASEVADQRERDAEVRGARWALEIALQPSRWPVSKWTPEEVCRDARERGEP
jgi:predicted anti-sigma-YlaC factor YlaD